MPDGESEKFLKKGLDKRPNQLAGLNEVTVLAPCVRRESYGPNPSLRNQTPPALAEWVMEWYIAADGVAV